MKSFEENTEHKILIIREKLIENYQLQRDCVKKYGYDDQFKKFNPTIKILNHQLKTIEDELRQRYNSLELNSENLIELQSITDLFVYFESVDISILMDIERKIIELTTIKEDALKKYDFRTANSTREEIRLLQQYFNKHK
jgi:hypothetical protein